MTRYALLFLGLMLLAGCTGWLPVECYKIPKYEWARCPYPEPYKNVRLPAVGYDGTRFGR